MQQPRLIGFEIAPTGIWHQNIRLLALFCVNAAVQNRCSLKEAAQQSGKPLTGHCNLKPVTAANVNQGLKKG